MELVTPALKKVRIQRLECLDNIVAVRKSTATLGILLGLSDFEMGEKKEAVPVYLMSV